MINFFKITAPFNFLILSFHFKVFSLIKSNFNFEINFIHLKFEFHFTKFMKKFFYYHLYDLNILNFIFRIKLIRLFAIRIKLCLTLSLIIILRFHLIDCCFIKSL